MCVYCTHTRRYFCIVLAHIKYFGTMFLLISLFKCHDQIKKSVKKVSGVSLLCVKEYETHNNTDMGLKDTFEQANILKYIIYVQVSMVVQQLTMSPHSKRVLGLNPDSTPFCVEFACLCGFSRGTPASSHTPKKCRLG